MGDDFRAELLRDERPTLPPPSYNLSPRSEEEQAYEWVELL